VRKILTLVLAAGLFAALPPSHSQQARSARDLAGFRSAIAHARSVPAPGIDPRTHEQVAHDIACGQTVNGTITTHDFVTDPPDTIYFDIFFFQGQAGQTITATMSSNAFNPFLILFDPDVNLVADDDDSGPGNAARIVFTLDQTSPDWSLALTPLEDDVTGPYTLSLQCSGNPPPPPPPPGPVCPSGYFGDASYPDFCFRVTIGNPGDTVSGTREPDCIQETVCTSGRLAGRSEVFVRIIGPRPNGFLWPTIVRFTPARVLVDIHQLSTTQTNTYLLPAVPPGVDDISGLQDRTGFLP
jgi:hypothetical protein